jgi:thiosulfate/3-mercaptopyruvate sulfurtransferase
MTTFVDLNFVAERLDNPNYLILDPRRPMKYLSGHLKNAVNLPAYRAFDEHLRLLSPEALAAWIGNAGLGSERTPIIYDSFDGQNAAILAWIMEYMGRTDVFMMDRFYEEWVAEKREVFYKPVETTPRIFTTRLNGSIRISAEEIVANPSMKLIDFRSIEEFNGARDMDGKPGHIPGAHNVVWRDLVSAEGFLTSGDRLQKIFAGAAIQRGDTLVSYCRSGLRAAVGYTALRQLGYEAKLYDGSYRDWIVKGLPTEI